LPIQVQEASRTPKRLGQNRTSPQRIIIKTTSTENREGILSFKIDGAIKIFHGKQKLKQIYDHQFTTTKDSPRNSAHEE
jgi:hypothetical protein